MDNLDQIGISSSNRSAMRHFFQGMLAYLTPDQDDEYSDIDLADKKKLWVETVHASEESVKEEDGNIVIKALDDEAMISYDPLYVNSGESDSHGDGITDEELDKLIENINLKIKEGTLKSKIHHVADTDSFSFLKASRMPMDAFIENPNFEDGKIKIEEGQPILKTQFHNKAMWEKKKAGKLKNPSIGGKGVREPNPDYQGD